MYEGNEGGLFLLELVLMCIFVGWCRSEGLRVVLWICGERNENGSCIVVGKIYIWELKENDFWWKLEIVKERISSVLEN